MSKTETLMVTIDYGTLGEEDCGDPVQTCEMDLATELHNKEHMCNLLGYGARIVSIMRLNGENGEHLLDKSIYDGLRLRNTR
jgi:hypothetical protein